MGAGVDITVRTVHYSFHPFYVGFPRPVRAPVGVGYLNAKGQTFATAITFCHLLHLLFSKLLDYNTKETVKKQVVFKKNLSEIEISLC